MRQFFTRAWGGHPWLVVVARVVMGGVWLVSGALKIGSPAESAAAVHAYELNFISFTIQDNIGYLLPPLELVLGLALILGVMTRGAAAVSTLLQIAYIAAIASVWARGLQIDCGCFGGGGYDPNASDKYPWDIARDVGLALLSIYTVWVGPGRFAIDSLLFRRSPPPSLTDLEGLEGLDGLDDEDDGYDQPPTATKPAETEVP